MSQSASILNKSVHGIYEDYELLNDDTTLLSFSYNISMNTARVEADGSKRLFIIDKEGLRKSKTVFTNEYGIKIGEIAFEKLHANEGVISLDEQRFNFRLPSREEEALLIYKTTKQEPLLSCKFLKYHETVSSGSHSNYQIIDNKYSGLLMALCWSLITSAEKKHVMVPVQ